MIQYKTFLELKNTTKINFYFNFSVKGCKFFLEWHCIFFAKIPIQNINLGLNDIDLIQKKL